MRATLMMLVSVMCAAGLVGMAIAGSMDSSGAPSAGSGMYTLSQIYDYLNSGTEATPIAAFQGPGAAPGSTMKTTREIYVDHKAMLDQCDATALDVALGKRFFSTVSGSWGVQTGKVCIAGTPTPTPTRTPTPTPTITPTPTSVMGTQASCTADSGYWGATQLGAPDDYGCWFSGASDTACDTICAGHNNRSCVSKNWNDNSTGSIAAGLGFTCWHYAVGPWGSPAHDDGMPFGEKNAEYYCTQRASNIDQNCTVGSGHVNWFRFCVCRR
ncbi:MAG: hypothetical protein NTZ78_14905 [Candidatus Aureabacteria bacterium]|nr:hypothetical protein [Candidatus Auribacterota bacterium]